MIHLTETLTVQTVENFLTAEDLTRLNKTIDEFVAAGGWDPVRGHEPVTPPSDAQDILMEATHKTLAVIQQVMPSVLGCTPWGYAQIEPGEQIPSHLHGMGLDSLARPRRLARITVVIQDADQGGEFYVETTSSPAVWAPKLPDADNDYFPGMRFARVAEHTDVEEGIESTAWVAKTPRTRWTTNAAAGVGVVYGAQLIHGVDPVIKGIQRKFVTNLIDEAM
jgi:hypothetical protein